MNGCEYEKDLRVEISKARNIERDNNVMVEIVKKKILWTNLLRIDENPPLNIIAIKIILK